MTRTLPRLFAHVTRSRKISFRTRNAALVCILAFGLTIHVSADQPAPDWPQWMGANHDGISAESGWSTNWSDEALPAKWTQEIGIGFSSVSVVGNRLYTMGNIGGIESVYCFNKLDGKEIWRHSYECKLVAVLYEGGPGATPTIVGNRVYTTGKEGQLMCLDANNGNIIWEKNLQKDLGTNLPEWGFNASPIARDGQLFVEAGRLVSYDLTTGKKNWQSEKHTPGYGSVRAFDIKSETFLASLDCDGLRINQASDGSQVAFEPWPSPFRTNCTTPIVREEKIFISSGYNVGCGLFQFDPSTKGEPGTPSLKEIYTSRKMRNHFNNSIVFNGHAYGFDGNSNLGRVVQLTCMDFQTGDVKWKHRGLGCGSLMIAGGKLILLSDDGRLVIANATPKEYEPLAESRILEGRCWTVPVLQDGCVYARNATGKLVCVPLPKEPASANAGSHQP